MDDAPVNPDGTKQAEMGSMLRLANTGDGSDNVSSAGRVERSSGFTQVLQSGGAGEGNSLTDAEREQSGKSSGGDSKAGSRMDTILGRLVVEQGLATDTELQEALETHNADEDPSRSFAQVLVEKQLVTHRQLDRIRQQADAERRGQELPGYKVLGKLGAGAMAVVYKARQLSLDRLVAVKVLPKKFSNNPQFIERFYAEGRAAAQLNHPNIVQAIDVGGQGEFHYFVMEYVDGKTVHDHIVDNKRYTEEEAIGITIAVTEALKHAHERGLIHRDVKPKNIMLTQSGVVKLADLGLARAMDDKDAALEEKGKAYGTPYYISPEQIRGEATVDGRADIYSLGATVYHMLTGNVPYNGKSPTEVMKHHIKSELVAPDHVNTRLSAGISEVIEKMMAKRRSARYQDCDTLLIDLRALKAGEDPPHAHREIGLSALAAAAAEAKAAEEVEIEHAQAPASSNGFTDGKVQLVLMALVAWGLLATVLAAFMAG